jgi:hypothetical protein
MMIHMDMKKMKINTMRRMRARRTGSMKVIMNKRLRGVREGGDWDVVGLYKKKIRRLLEKLMRSMKFTLKRESTEMSGRRKGSQGIILQRKLRKSVKDIGTYKSDAGEKFEKDKGKLDGKDDCNAEENVLKDGGRKRVRIRKKVQLEGLKV